MKKIVSSFIIFFLIVAIASVCFAASTGTTIVDNLRLRKGASTNSEAIDVLNNGTKVNIISTENDFYKVKVGDETGYVSKKYVRTGETANTTKESNDKETTNNTTSQNSTENSETNANKETTTNTDNTVANDTEVTTNAIVNASATNTDTSTVSSWNEEEINKANTTNLTSDTKLYALPLLNSTELTDIKSGSEVLLISVNGKWAYIQTNSQSGWVDKNTLKVQKVTVPGEKTEISESETNNKALSNSETSNENSSNTTSNQEKNGQESSEKNMYVTATSVRVRSFASTSGKVVTTLTKGSSVTILSTTSESDGDWYKVKTSSGEEGYILGKYLSENK